MRIGVIADDFTGGSDIALTLSDGGAEVVEYVGIPDEAADKDVQAGVVALKIRTEPAGHAIAEALAACEWLLAQGCRQIVYKVCSTFDSTSAGNIGPVTEALAARLGEETVLICPAFPENGRSVYQGHLFVFDRLLSESGMQHHPLTPMTDSDLRRVLAAQTSWPVGHIPAKVVASGRRTIAEAASGLGKSMVIVDAVKDDDLMEIGRAAAGRKLLVGGSGIALGLGDENSASGKREWGGVKGRGVVLSGSCSIATRAQVGAYKDIASAFELDAESIIEGRYSPAVLKNWALDQQAAPLIYSSADPAVVTAAQEKFGRVESAAVIEGFFSRLASELAGAGFSRIVVAGGETSGAVVSGLDAKVLSIGPKIAAGVPAVKVKGKNLALALKSGNFGGRDFFSQALDVLGAEQ